MGVCVSVYCYQFRKFFRCRDNKHPSGTPTCELLKRLIYSPEIHSQKEKKKRVIKKANIHADKFRFSRNEQDEHKPRL